MSRFRLNGASGSHAAPLAPQTASTRWLIGLAAAVGAGGLAFLLAWVTTGFQSLDGWSTYLAGIILAAALLWGGWLAVQAGEKERLPGWLATLLIGAALLRLGAAVIWSVGLPRYGHATEAELSGYVMSDAHKRDQVAWELATSERYLWKAFEGGYRKADQYGGLLFLSAFLYRYLGGAVHPPLLMVLITAAVSALAIVFLYAFCRRAWGPPVAALAARGLALYPEAVLLGSSQMREAFTVTLVAAAFYGLLRYRQEHRWPSLGWVVAALLLSLPLSPVFTVFILGMLAVLALFLGRDFLHQQFVRRRWLWLVVAGLAAAALLAAYVTLRQMAPEGMTNPVAVVSWWLRKSAEWQLHLTERASGWMQRYFDALPDWMPMPLVVMYGVLQPFLPAALISTSTAPAWTAIAIWRALGWTVLLPLLVYAPLRLLRPGEGPNRGLARGLVVIVWLVILITSYRSGGDLWDNARYRAAFAAPQVALAAWTVAAALRRPDPWMHRVLVTIALVIGWFIPWYLRRSTAFVWPVEDVFKTLALGLASGVLYSLYDWARSSSERKT